MELSPEQRAAVERSGQDVCVVAGPGSGKTRVLVERFAWLVEQQNVDPGRILAITFTEKAARMMKRRLVDRFGARAELREAMERAWVMTIDAFCARLLRENAIEAGLPPDFTVLEESAADRMRREAAETSLDKLFQERPHDLRRLMEALALSTSDDGRQIDLAESLLAGHEEMRLAGIRELPAAQAQTGAFAEARRLAAELGRDSRWNMWHDWARRFQELPEAPLLLRHFELAAEYKPQFKRTRRANHPAASGLEDAMKTLQAQWIVQWNAGMPELLRAAVARLDQEYREAKRRQSAVDFTDLAERTIELLESDAALRQRIAGQFDHVLMDELQDTNRLQWKLAQLVRRSGRFFAVGDINQSIYGFRHADRTVFAEFRAELRNQGHPVDELRENYRSRPEILETVARVLEGCEGVEAHQLKAKRERGSPAPVMRLTGAGDRAVENEAELAASCIAAWSQSEARPWGHFAILVRALASAEPFERALEKRGIPFLVSGGRTFMETREARDVLALLAALVNPLDEFATAGVLRGPLVGWTDQELLNAGASGRLEAFEKLFGRARKLAGFVPTERLLAMILDERGYLSALTDRGRANLDKLLGWIRREYRKQPRPLAELLEDLEALRESQAEAEAPPQQASDAVNIMTMHAAKGLEYKVVFVGALHRPPKQGSPVLLVSRDLGLGVKWRHPVTGEALKDSAHEALSDRLKQRESAEEQRLLYVAMTRAEDRLVLSFARVGRAAPLQKLVERAVPESGDAVPRVESLPPLEGNQPSPREELVLEAPPVTEQHDSSASVTGVALFTSCPQKYFWARYVGLHPEPDAPGTGAIELGLETHKALAGGHSDSVEALDLVRQFEATELGRRMARAARIEREFDFLLAMDGVVLRGQIDAWFEEGGELILVDYKTDSGESGLAEYSVQLRLYALALERYAGRLPDRALLCFLRSGRITEVGLRRQGLEETRDIVRALARAQDGMDFPLKVGQHCRRCLYYGNSCPAKLEEAALTQIT